MRLQGKYLRKARSARRGFTMMEIVVVVIIIAIMFAVAMPSMRGMAENNRLRSSVREIMSLMKYARSEAVFNSRTTEVFIDAGKHQYWLDLRTPDPDTGRYNPKDPKTTMERKRNLEKKVYFTDLNVITQNILDNNIVAVDFYPDGTASPALLSVANDRGIEYTIEVFKSTGLVELNEGNLQEVQTVKGERNYPLPDNYYEGYNANEAVQ